MSDRQPPHTGSPTGLSDDRPVVDFDHHAPDFADEAWSIYRTIRTECPVAWSEHHDGFWVVSRYEDVSRIARDDVTFSSAREVVLPRTGSGRLIPLHSDPPDLLRHRKALQPFFTLAAVEAMEPAIRRYTTATIDAFIERGSAELVRQLSNPVPALTTLHMLGLPVSDWRAYMGPVHAVSLYRAGDAAQDRGQTDVAEMRAQLDATIRDEDVDFAEDTVIGHLRALQTNGRIDADEVVDLATMVIFGGLDTTSSSLGNALVYLDAHPEAATALRQDPTAIPHAVDELLRWESPVQGFARTVTEDCVVGDQTIAAGETVFMAWASANRDPEVFDEPEEVRLDRHPNRHLSFGIGGHRCLGATLARVEMRILLEEILRRLPDLRITRALRPDTVGVVYGFASISATFTPGPVEGSVDPASLDLDSA